MLKTQTLILIISLLLFFSGLAFFLYLQFMFPKLVPHHGGRERFNIIETDDFTFQIPWTANTRFHLLLQANDTITLYTNDEYVCECTHYDLTIEPGEYVLVTLRSESPVTGIFTARQEIQVERKLLTITLLMFGLIGVILSLRKGKGQVTVKQSWFL